MTTATQTLRLTNAEIAYLAALTGAPVVVGVPDPFSGAFPGQIAEQMATARDSLLERHAIGEGPGGALTVTPAWAVMLSPVLAPEAMMLVSRRSAAHAASTAVLYLAHGRLVEQTCEQALVHLTELDPDRGADHARRLVGLPAERAVPAASGRVANQALAKAAQLARDGGPALAREALVEGGLSPETAALFAETLATPERSWLVRFLRGGEAGWGSSSISVTEGSGGCFALRETGGGAVAVDPQPARLVNEMAEGFVAEVPAVDR